MTVPLGTFDYDDENRFFVGLEVFSATSAEVQVHIIDCTGDLDELGNDQKFITALAQHVGDVLRVDGVTLMLNEVMGDSILFDFA